MRVIALVICVILFKFTGQTTAATCYSCTDLGDACTNDHFKSSSATSISCSGSCYKTWTLLLGATTSSARGCDPTGCTNDACSKVAGSGSCKYCCNPANGNDNCNGGGFVQSSKILMGTMIILVAVMLRNRDF